MNTISSPSTPLSSPSSPQVPLKRTSSADDEVLSVTPRASSLRKRNGSSYEEQLWDETEPVNSNLTSSPKRKRSSTVCYLSKKSINEDCLLLILWHLPFEEIMKLSLTNHELRALAGQEHLWKRLCQMDFRAEVNYFYCTFSIHRVCQDCFWKGFYRLLCSLKIGIEFINGPRTGDVLSIPLTGVQVGRSRTNNICVLMDDMVSRKHLEIAHHGNRYWIQDVGGINGTFVNSKCLPQFVATRLHLGEVVEFGGSAFIVHPQVHLLSFPGGHQQFVLM